MSFATLRLAVRVLWRRKVFTAISLFGVTFTLLVLVLVSALLDGLLAPRPPESNADRTLAIVHARMVGENMRSSGPPGLGLLEPLFRDLPGDPIVSMQIQARTEAAWVDGAKHPVEIMRTDGAFWSAHDFRFLEGRPFGSDEDASGAAVAVISKYARDSLFGGAAADGRTFELDGRAFRVVGVVDDVSSLRMRSFAEAWLPLGSLPGAPDRTALIGNFTGIVIARKEADIEPLRAELAARAARIPLGQSQYTSLEVPIERQAQAIARELIGADPGDGDPVRRIRVGVIVLSLAFMLLPALNLVTLTMSRVLERAPEIGVRKAFGATRGQLVAQFVVENVLLTLLGGLLALALAPLVMAAIASSLLGIGPGLSVSVSVLLQGLAFAVVFGVLSGAWPAWRMSRLPPIEALRGRSG